MDNQAILTKAISLAIDGGWDFLEKYEVQSWDVIDVDGSYDKLPSLAFMHDGKANGLVSGTQFIYSHEFAKALWGEEVPENKLVINGRTYGKTLPKYQHRLQQMVIAEDPIKYLGENL